MKLSPLDLEKIVNRLIAIPPEDEKTFQEKQKYLEMALDQEQKCDIFLMSAEKESEIINQFLCLEVEYENASKDEKPLLKVQLSNLEKKIEAAAKVSILCKMVEDHSLRGNIRYLKRFLEGSIASPTSPKKLKILSQNS